MRILFRWFRLATVCCLFLLLSVLGVGQTKPHGGRISVPFEFEVGGTKCPAGQYIVGVLSSLYGQLHSADGKVQQAMYFTATGEPEKNPRVVFVVRNKKYFFSGVLGWYGKMQYTGFSPHTEDEIKEIPITSAE